jgi:predicted trehalose synthase
LDILGGIAGLLTAMLLERFAAPAAAGHVRFRTLPGERIRTGAVGRMLTGEQSNTSLVFGEDYVLKTFRRVWPGPNPDLELNLGLAEHGSQHVAPPYGWIEMKLDGTPTTLANCLRMIVSARPCFFPMPTTSVQTVFPWPMGSADPASRPGATLAGAAGIAKTKKRTNARAKRIVIMEVSFARPVESSNLP